MFVKTRRSRMHGTFQVSACPPRVRASNSAVCTRVATLGGRHAHVRCLAERSSSPAEGKGENEVEKMKER